MENEPLKRPLWIPSLAAPTVFALLTLAMFGDLLVAPRGRVVSHQTTDLALQFIPWRQFGFSELRAGNLALWNPHVFGGAPYFAGFQSALLYPPNWLHLILPLGPAINWIVALHVFLAGYFTYLWVRFRGVSVPGAIIAGAMFMFSGPYFLHVYAGHLPHVAVMIWAPLILLAIDGLTKTGSWRWMFLGAVAVAMQVLAGHPQYVYYTGIAVAVYVALSMITSSRRAGLALGFITIYVGGAMLAAVQLLPGIDAQRESVRSIGTGYAFASTFSLPPQNLITLLAPNFFGWLPMNESADALAGSYWGTGYLWEMSVFASLTGLFLAVFAVAPRRGSTWWISVCLLCIAVAVRTISQLPLMTRQIADLLFVLFVTSHWRSRTALTVVAVTLVLALGRYTPLYRPMFDWIPKYDSFRGTAKFAHLTILFVSLLAGIGYNELLRRGRAATGWLIALSVAALLMLLGAWAISTSPEWWGNWVRSGAKAASSSQELFTRTVGIYDDPVQLAATCATAARGLFLAGVTCAIVTAIVFAMRWKRMAAYALPVVAIIELFIFAHSTRATMVPTFGFRPVPIDNWPSVDAAWRSAISRLPKDARVMSEITTDGNVSMLLGYNDVWGYDPGVLRRYAELLTLSQGGTARSASQYLPLRQPVQGIFEMLRCKFILRPDAKQPVYEIPNPLPIVTVVSDWVQLGTPESVVGYMMQPGFDARKTVVLEASPGVATKPAADPPGSATVVSSGTDWLEIRAELSRPGILLITNSYSTGWRATSISGSSQSIYRIVPADWAMQGIPLEAGKHHLRVEYRPAAFVVGKWISIVSIVGFAAVGAGILLMNRRRALR